MQAVTKTGQNGDRVPATAGAEPDKPDLIVRSALALAAAQGVSRMTLRDVAAGCGVSLGLVQYYFPTKAALIAAIDEHVLAVVSDNLTSRPLRGGPQQAPEELHGRFVELLARDSDATAYVARALCDGDPIGAVIFDRLLDVSAAHAPTAAGPASAQRPDQLWAAINPLILGLGTIMFRNHIERHLDHPLDTPEQLARWHSAATSVIREGYFRRRGD
jgi:AcrR family transcriptional regulator